MFVNTNNYLKSGVVIASHVRKREYRFSSRAPWKYSFQPAFNLIDHRELHFQARGKMKSTYLYLKFIIRAMNCITEGTSKQSKITQGGPDID